MNKYLLITDDNYKFNERDYHVSDLVIVDLVPIDWDVPSEHVVSNLVETWINNRLNDNDDSDSDGDGNSNNSQLDDKYISMIKGVRPLTNDEIINFYFNCMAYKFKVYTNRVWDTTNLEVYHLLKEFMYKFNILPPVPLPDNVYYGKTVVFIGNNTVENMFDRNNYHTDEFTCHGDDITINFDRIVTVREYNFNPGRFIVRRRGSPVPGKATHLPFTLKNIVEVQPEYDVDPRITYYYKGGKLVLRLFSIDKYEFNFVYNRFDIPVPRYDSEVDLCRWIVQLIAGLKQDIITNGVNLTY